MTMKLMRKKRQIKILKPEFAYALEQELKNVFNP